MARKIKIPNERLKQFAREEQKRKKNIRIKRKYYLIVCEGAATEPNYFEGLKQDLPKGILTSYQIDIEGTGMNTQSLINEAFHAFFPASFTHPAIYQKRFCVASTVFQRADVPYPVTGTVWGSIRGILFCRECHLHSE